MSEHDCIKQLIANRWWGEVERFVHPLPKEARQHLFGERRSVAARPGNPSTTGSPATDECEGGGSRAAAVARNAALRSEGKNYPDFYEVQCSSNWSRVDGSQDF